MKLDSVVDAGFEALASLRHARVFHPQGVLARGRLRVADARGEYLIGAPECPVAARFSKAASTPGGWPDVLGFALRMHTTHGPWDLALATVGGTGTVSRFAITPTRGWVHACYGSLMPYRLADSPPLWLFAEPGPKHPGSASLSDMRAALRTDALPITLHAKGIGGKATVLAQLELESAPDEPAPDAFDPVLNTPPAVELLPRWVAAIRAQAYRGSRRGRHSATGGARR